MEKNDQLYLYAEEKIGKAIFLLAIPSILSSLINLIYNLINSIFIKMLNNTAMVAATTVGYPVMTFVHAFGSALGVGASSYLSRQLGAGSYEDSKKTVKTAITSGIIISLVLAISAFFWLMPILKLLTDDPEVLKFSYIYSLITIVGGITAILKQILIGLLRTEGDIVFPMYVLLISVFLNIFLVPILMFDWGFDLQIGGAALATVIVQGISVIIMFVRLSYRCKYVKWRLFDFGIDKKSLSEITSVGSAVFMRNLLPSISSGIFANSASLFGTAFVAGVGIGKRASHFALFAIQGMANGYLTFAAYNYGADNKDRLKQSMSMLIKNLTLYSILVSILFIAFAPAICSLYSNDPEVIAFGSIMLKFYTISLINQGAYNILLIVLQAFGRNRDSMMVSIARGALFYIPFIYLLPRFIGPTGVYLAQPLADWLTVFTILYISRYMLKEIFFAKEID
ncbi:MAG: MATE family efflux transporter [Erysipelotrichaceae bacterium]|nr:MATE family efflux transporter [Erysipelotrichaceae bacterium]